eukprot:PhM_4_TR9560/c0_g1_i2/m.38071
MSAHQIPGRGYPPPPQRIFIVHNATTTVIMLLLLHLTVSVTNVQCYEWLKGQTFNERIEHLCGRISGSSTIEMTSNICSKTNPSIQIKGPVVVNHIGKRVYFASYFGMMFGHPIPGEGTGSLELMAGPLGCSGSGCQGGAVGTFAQTRFKYPSDMHGSAYLHPLYLVYDVLNRKVVSMDVSTSTSSYYAGDGSTTSSNSFNNVDKLSAPLPTLVTYSSIKSDGLSVYLAGSHLVRISLTTGLMTAMLYMNGNGYRSIAIYNGDFYIIYSLYTSNTNTYIIKTPVVSTGLSTLDMAQPTWQLPDSSSVYFFSFGIFPASSTNTVPFAMNGQGRILRYHSSTNVWESSTKFFDTNGFGFDVHGEYLYALVGGCGPSCRLRVFAPTRSPTATVSSTVTPSRPSTHTATQTLSVSAS